MTIYVLLHFEHKKAPQSLQNCLGLVTLCKSLTMILMSFSYSNEMVKPRREEPKELRTNRMFFKI